MNRILRNVFIIANAFRSHKRANKLQERLAINEADIQRVEEEFAQYRRIVDDHEQMYKTTIHDLYTEIDRLSGNAQSFTRMEEYTCSLK